MDNRVPICFCKMPTIHEAGKVVINDLWRHQERVSEYSAMIIVDSGVFKVVEDDVDYNVKQNDILFLKGGAHQFGKIFIEKGTSWYWIEFYDCETENMTLLNEDNIKHIDRSFCLKEDYDMYTYLPKIFNTKKPDFYINRIKQIRNLLKSQNGLYLVHIGIIALEIFINAYEENIENKADNNLYICNKIIELLRNDINDKISSSVIADSLNMNYSYLSRIFKKYIGINIIKYFMIMKTEKSMELLKETDLTINEISEMLSFQNQFYFSKVFKSFTGLTPTDYRKNALRSI